MHFFGLDRPLRPCPHTSGHPLRKRAPPSRAGLFTHALLLGIEKLSKAWAPLAFSRDPDPSWRYNVLPLHVAQGLALVCTGTKRNRHTTQQFPRIMRRVVLAPCMFVISNVGTYLLSEYVARPFCMNYKSSSALPLFS